MLICGESSIKLSGLNELWYLSCAVGESVCGKGCISMNVVCGVLSAEAWDKIIEAQLCPHTLPIFPALQSPFAWELDAWLHGDEIWQLFPLT